MITFRMQDRKELPLHYAYTDFPVPGTRAGRGAQVFHAAMLHDIVVRGGDVHGDYGGKYLILINGNVTKDEPYDVVLPENVNGVSFHDPDDVERMLEELIGRTGMDELDASEMLAEEMASQARWKKPKWVQTLSRIPADWDDCDEIEVIEHEGEVVLVCDDGREHRPF